MEYKTCKDCKIEKETIEFYKDKTMKLGCLNFCKQCMSIRRKNNPKIKELNRKFREKNKEKYREYGKKYREENKEYHREYGKKYREENKDDIRKYKQIYYISNIDNIKSKRETNKDKMKEYNSSYKKNRYKNDKLFRYKKIVNRLIMMSFKRNNFKKCKRSIEILGCDIPDFIKYIESKFEPWMSWDNRGLYNGCPNYGWDFDHITPLCVAETEEDVIKLNHYTNIQPLCSYMNRDVKKDKLNEFRK